MNNIFEFNINIPKTLKMSAKRAFDVTTTVTSLEPTSVETGRIRKSSWDFAFCYYHSTHSVLCLLHLYSILLEKNYQNRFSCRPSMPGCAQVPRCSFQSEPPPFPVSYRFPEPRTLCEDTQDQLLCNCYAIITNIGRCGNIGHRRPFYYWFTYYFISSYFFNSFSFFLCV